MEEAPRYRVLAQYLKVLSRDKVWCIVRVEAQHLHQASCGTAIWISSAGGGRSSWNLSVFSCRRIRQGTGLEWHEEQSRIGSNGMQPGGGRSSPAPSHSPSRAFCAWGRSAMHFTSPLERVLPPPEPLARPPRGASRGAAPS